ncbi:hypothetical protein AXW38_09920 [Yersinia ruckeri]|uniref:hypothetical protein n=1 Tax=Yersinia ruckeri TaxID=29486 RepID=UPI0004E330AE|nr:hypothetical protein [Yersinia ruckeri]ARZ01317.1 hypothetical protein QMA0440_01984 [Yersinia ruckeri]EKN4700362.1 hypothetical protein [Yersinia ruckeri]ELM3740231.1 hypothetical protein [Yersinia ruckeri]KFE37338.1 hypothetical protein nADLYRO1b_3297 [Yersinia ruckeri]MCW6563896.1 hypothetical protein [Yersinia ruckeri]
MAKAPVNAIQPTADLNGGTPVPDMAMREDTDLKPRTGVNQKVSVMFVAPYHRYSRNDLAGFSAEEAERLVKKGVAHYPGDEPNDTDAD